MGYTPPYLNVRKVAGGIAVDPGGASTEDLTIYPNGADTVAHIKLNGLSSVELHPAAGAGVDIFDYVTQYGSIGYASPDMIITCIIADKNISLVPSGTGKVKFGTFTGSGDVAVNGSISILDSGGSARKLATVA